LDPWHIGARMRYWRRQRGLSTRQLADLVGRSPSWVSMAEEGRRSPYNLFDLVNLAVALRLDLGELVTTPVPGIPDADQRAMLALLRQAFAGRDPKAALAELARSPQAADAEDLLLVVVGPGGLRVANRRERYRRNG
jgi:transcriptional regulator with XRE-family HTH domain